MAFVIPYIPYALAAVAAAGAVRVSNIAQSQAKNEKESALETANANEEALHTQNAQRLAEQRAAAAQSGFDPNEGSFLGLQTQSAGFAFLGELNTRYQGQIAGWQADNAGQRAGAQKDGAIASFASSAGGAGLSAWGAMQGPPIVNGSNPNGYLGTYNNASAFVSG